MATWFLVIIYLAFISLGLPDSLLGSAWPVMQPELNTSFDSAGVIAMIIAAGTIVSSLASGKMIEWLGTGKVTLISCLMTAAALLGFSAAPSLMWLLLLAIPLGLGAGSVDAALNNYVAAHYKAHHMNWLHCFWGVGATMGPIIMSFYMAGQGSWRGGYAAVAVIQFALVVILLVTLPLWSKIAAVHEHNKAGGEPEAEHHRAEAGTAGASAKTKIFRIKGVKTTLIAFLFYCGVEMTVGLWGASFLVGAHELDAQTAAAWISMYYGGITAGRLISGFITLKVSNKLLIRSGQLVALAGGVIMLLPLPDYFLLVGLILIGLGLAPIYPGLLHETPARFGKENSTRLMGYQMAVAYTGTTLLPPLFGFIAAKTTVAIFPFTVLLFLGLMFMSAENVNRVICAKRTGI
ncbi:MFS transporter [Paenibacillus sp. FSL R7-0331]|uniref:MFS transporter n=1 Tax=Paenibacillus sp. FSL R7-0331 TaxID=1536773 RepID=UPI0004F5AE1A|nr:MFS transporter [Paenibacillus sp. FSL R7-0331]AIQ52836.1 MFS transporter [Paenibacillus sp. FSL R7-0331]